MTARSALQALAVSILMAAAANAGAEKLLLPVSGMWAAIQGPYCGPTVMSGHCHTEAQRYAYDFVPLDGFDQPDLQGCVGRPVFSPGYGVVVAKSDELPDTPSPSQHSAGNHIVIKRTGNEYILIAHFKQHSIRFATGDIVAVGDRLGRCGYNGNATHPHVHIHMQTSPDILDFQGAKGLPMYFTNVNKYDGWNCVAIPSPVLLLRGDKLCQPR
jgi:murein DD-endopeptidase MepM/ murein hydrolase activator NlpD